MNPTHYSKIAGKRKNNEVYTLILEKGRQRDNAKRNYSGFRLMWARVNVGSRSMWTFHQERKSFVYYIVY